MLEIQAPKVYRGNSTSLFMAGGITDCPDWQRLMIQTLSHLPIVIFNPRAKEFDVHNVEAQANQERWEFTHLKKSTATSFWFPCETLCPITLFELGSQLQSNKPIFVGAHPDYARKDAIIGQVALYRPDIKVVHDLDELTEQITRWFITQPVTKHDPSFGSPNTHLFYKQIDQILSGLERTQAVAAALNFYDQVLARKTRVPYALISDDQGLDEIGQTLSKTITEADLKTTDIHSDTRYASQALQGAFHSAVRRDFRMSSVVTIATKVIDMALGEDGKTKVYQDYARLYPPFVGEWEDSLDSQFDPYITAAMLQAAPELSAVFERDRLNDASYRLANAGRSSLTSNMRTSLNMSYLEYMTLLQTNDFYDQSNLGRYRVQAYGIRGQKYKN